MSDEEIRKYLSGRSAEAKPATPMRMVRRKAPAPKKEETYQDFSATHLYCPGCRQATPVREKILLFLSDGDLYDYSCTVCGTSVGTRKAGH